MLIRRRRSAAADQGCYCAGDTDDMWKSDTRIGGIAVRVK
jgi:hypothetical protein